MKLSNKLFLFLVILSLSVLLGCGSKSDSASSSAGTVVRIVVTPNPGSIPNSSSSQFEQFTAVGYDSNNQPVTGIKFTWTDPGTSSCIDQNGKATATGLPPSPETILANYGSLSQPATLNIGSTALISPPIC